MGASTEPSRATFAMHQREVLAFHRACLQLPHQVGLRFQRLGHDQEAAGVLVQAMHDARARNGGERRVMMQQAVEQRALPIAAARMHYQTGGLIEHQQRGVLVDDIEIDGLGRGRAVPRFGLGRERNALPAPDLALGIDRGMVERHLALFYPGGEAAARMLGKHLRQRLVEAHSGAIGRNLPLGGRDCVIILRFPNFCACHHAT